MYSYFPFFLLRRHIIRAFFSLSLSLATARHIKPFASFAPARGHPDEMGFDDKAQVNPSDGGQSAALSDQSKQHLGQRAEGKRREGRRTPPRPKKNGEGKYGATEYVRENEHFEKYYKAQKYARPTRV